MQRMDFQSRQRIASLPWAVFAMPAGELLGDQLPMPAQRRIGSDGDRSQFEQSLTWNTESLARQQRTLPIREAKRAPFEPLAQHAVFRLQVLNNDDLLTVDPTGEEEDDKRNGRRFELHPQSLARRARLCSVASHCPRLNKWTLRQRDVARPSN